MKHTSNFPPREKRQIIDAAIEPLMVPSSCCRFNDSFNRDGLPRNEGPFYFGESVSHGRRNPY